MNLHFIWETFLALLTGVPVTLKLATVSVVAGMILALFLAVLRLSRFRLARWAVAAYVFAFRGSPMLVQIFLIYYGLGQFRSTLQALHLWYWFRDPYFCVLLALSLNTAAYGCEIIRGGLQSVSAQQVEAGRACGMSGLLLFRRITLPIAVRNVVPIYGNEIILMVKATSLASTVTIMEITGIAAKLIAETYRAFEVFAAAGAIYLLINFVLMRLIAFVERALSPHLRRSTRPVETIGALAATH
ncbi:MULTISPECIES: ABC transporter permease [unclassified Neorhizobium]|uniref:ABC transporter permease n=1 Tax=unclassified Neorhizobium TaxID=2629175 RepID=UPI001FF1EC4A|nr:MULTISPECIES: ABC transporter permease [unclassified Neorhizobium]MCJ9670353.1 ABC transporter permease [Neorhizobium sp. SHOUNA12B]MCJ9746608.1 ABC transporter permease [Neorhizobium sp. SHOUNA12A]